MYQHIKAKHHDEIGMVLRLHRSGAGGIRIALALTHQLDTFLQTIFQHLENDAGHLTIIALGGYGRKELCFSSDTDIMFLIAEEQQRSLAEPAVQEFLHRLLDAGLDVGHSFRTILECIALPDEDFESQMSLLEARYICGNLTLFKKLLGALQNKMKVGDRKTFVQRISDMRQRRYQKYGNSSKLLEPNIKNSAGGLRDLHTVLWLMRGTGSVSISRTLGISETAILQILKTSVIKNQFAPSFLQEARCAFDTLLRIRNEMHIRSKSLHDTLEFSFQTHVASHLRYRAHSKKTQVEKFMQDYYTASRTIALLCSRIIDWASDRWIAESTEAKTTKISKAFVLRGKRIYQTKPAVPITNELILHALLIRCDRRVSFSFKFEDAIHRRLYYFKPLSTKTETDIFRLLLHRPNGVAHSLRKINQLGLLERWIPEWKPMVSFFQHNQYHYYTADEHTLIVLANAEALEQSSSSFGPVYRSLPRRDILYLSCLLHDIAKPLHIGKHEIKGVPIAKRVLRRLMYEDIIEDVSFLIRHHLLMEQVAFRRNLNDPQTIIDFARIFDRIEQLDYLYILTYADLSAVNKNVWTDWKELLLHDLYHKTRAVLVEEMTSEQIHRRTAEQAEEKREDAIRRLVPEFPPEEVEEHLALFSDTSYLATFFSGEIANHLQIIRRHEGITTLFQQSDRYTEITFIAYDAPGLLSKFCGVLTANDANILDAQVFTRRDGIVIDKFRVVDFIKHNSLPQETCNRISRDVKETVEGRVNIAHLIKRHRMRWKRRTQPINPNIRIDVEFEDHPQFTIIDIYAPDTLGFLYRITETISLLNLNITFAKIATRVDGIVDSFYLTDENGKKIDNPAKRETAKREILASIRNVSESELVESTTNL